jgi:3-oxoacyl-[acyl-carrier-protein] synthase II
MVTPYSNSLKAERHTCCNIALRTNEEIEALERRRVAITGIGLVTPIGISWQNFWRAALQGESGIRKIVGFDTTGFVSRIAGQVLDFKPSKWINPRKLKYLSRPVQLAVAAAKMALGDSHLSITEEMQEKVAVFMGTSSNAIDVVEDQFDKLKSTGPQSVSPFAVASCYPGAPASNVAIELGLKGETFTLSTGCSSSTNAIGLAFRSIRFGQHDVAIAGGVDAPVTPLMMSAFGNALYLSQRNGEPEKASRPFERNRDGYVLSEAAGILVLEEYSAAVKRDALIYAEIAGYASTSDCFSMLRVEPNGVLAAKAIRRALRDAAIASSEVDYFNAHGSSSVMSDRRETRVIKEVFDGRAFSLQVSSVKSMIGQPIGASGAIQTATCALALREQTVPPTTNYEEQDPDCDLDYVPNEAREARVRVAVNNCLGIGGNNACLVLKNYSG